MQAAPKSWMKYSTDLKAGISGPGISHTEGLKKNLTRQWKIKSKIFGRNRQIEKWKTRTNRQKDRQKNGRTDGKSLSGTWVCSKPNILATDYNLGEEKIWSCSATSRYNSILEASIFMNNLNNTGLACHLSTVKLK